MQPRGEVKGVIALVPSQTERRKDGTVAKFGDASKLELCSSNDLFGRQVSENFFLCGRNFG
jgi:hypothetical protein